MNNYFKTFLSTLVIVVFAAGLMSSMSYAEKGWCCKDGYIYEITKDECMEKGGKFFLTEKEAIKYCTYEDPGWCCLNGMVYKSTPEICKEKGGVYFATEADAKKFCEEGELEEGWCCLDGAVFPATPEECKKKGGMYFPTKAAAEKYCETGEETGWCCFDGIVFAATPEVCKKKGGVYFLNKTDAIKYCEEGELEEGWCCFDGMVFAATPEVCKKKGGVYFPTKPAAIKYCEKYSKLPDLQVVNIFLNKKCQVVVKVRNNGPGMVPDSVWTVHTPESSSVYIYINGKKWGGGTIWGFDTAKALKMPGGTALYTSKLVVKTSAKITATVDHTLQVAETVETNNKLSKYVKCGLKMLKTKRIIK